MLAVVIQVKEVSADRGSDFRSLCVVSLHCSRADLRFGLMLYILVFILGMLFLNMQNFRTGE